MNNFISMVEEASNQIQYTNEEMQALIEGVYGVYSILLLGLLFFFCWLFWNWFKQFLDL